MSSIDKKYFKKRVTLLIDSREQKNQHIIAFLDAYGIMHETKKLDYADYSFSIDGRDFSNSCVVERKANIDELYGNVTHDRERIEKELDTISKNTQQCTLLIENCDSWNELRAYKVPEEKMISENRKVDNIGATVHSTLQAWQCGNRYGFHVDFVKDPKATASKILEIFFWYYHNFKLLTAPRK